MNDDLAEVAVDQQTIAGADHSKQSGCAENRRQAESTSQDCGAALRTSGLGGNPNDVFGV